MDFDDDLKDASMEILMAMTPDDLLLNRVVDPSFKPVEGRCQPPVDTAATPDTVVQPAQPQPVPLQPSQPRLAPSQPSQPHPAPSQPSQSHPSLILRRTSCLSFSLTTRFNLLHRNNGL
ncbi:hypothetical protein M422DRAFT_261582 [Sphaerobolus stellatus SS14]|uniref:Uncharacterized protein n=1 Tax=Sphaerobolus stellatus (strain SS14) TaxID=990650 RepID=A0A0C9UMF6_SPHS4|nr:hypothetical protein M422DRAFT_261582 [Sphaerobolus stellatus SS14]